MRNAHGNVTLKSMSDAGTPQGPQQARQARQQPATRLVRAQIESLPETVHDSTGAQRIRGEVVGTRDGITRIRTREGEVRLRLPQAQRLSPGRAVEIEVSSGNAREQAIIRLQSRRVQLEASLSRQGRPLPQTSSAEVPPRDAAVRSDTARARDTQPERQRIQLSRELARSLSRARQASLGGRAQNLTSGQPVRLIALDTQQSAKFLRQLPQPLQIRLGAAQLAALTDSLQSATNNSSNLQSSSQATSARLVPRIGALIAALQAGTLQGTVTQTQQPTSLLSAPLPGQGQIGTAANLTFTNARTVAQSLVPAGAGSIVSLTAAGGALSTSATSVFQPGAPTSAQPGTGRIDAQFLSQPRLNVTLKSAGQQPIISLSAGAQANVATGAGSARLGPPSAHQLINTQIGATTGFTPQSGALTGQVIGQMQNGLPVLQLNLPGTNAQHQLFTLQFNAGNFGPGAQASFTAAGVSGSAGAQTGIQVGAQTSLLGLSTGQLINLPVSTGTSALFTAAGDGAAGLNLADDLGEAIQTLQSSGNTQMARTVQGLIPNAANTQQLGPAAMLFVAAARGGDLSNWLGNNSIEMLRRAGRGDLASRLTGATGNITGAGGATDAAGGEWRSLQLPVAWQEEIHTIRLHYRHPGQGDEQDNSDANDKQTRFVFDLHLSRMGAVQLDGFFKEKRLDLVVRTEERLSGDMRQQIRYNYTNALEAAGLHGELRFQNAPGSWVVFRGRT